MAGRLDGKSAGRGFEVRNPHGLNALDLLTIIVVVAMLTVLLQVSLTKQGRTMAEPLNWLRATATQIVQNTFGNVTTATASPATASLAVEGVKTLPVAGATRPTDRTTKNGFARSRPLVGS
jgi:hypothetical protein